MSDITIDGHRISVLFSEAEIAKRIEVLAREIAARQPVHKGDRADEQRIALQGGQGLRLRSLQLPRRDRRAHSCDEAIDRFISTADDARDIPFRVIDPYHAAVFRFGQLRNQVELASENVITPGQNVIRVEVRANVLRGGVSTAKRRGREP